MFESYEKYLELIDAVLAKCFKQSETFVFCREGCSLCCEKGQYPFSELEYRYLLHGAMDLRPELLTLIEMNIASIKEQKKDCENEADFLYRCPFLIENRCCVYKHRAIICRTHGLAFYLSKDGETKLPGCLVNGLNYSNVAEVTEEGGIRFFSEEKCRELGIEDRPPVYDLSLKSLMNNHSVKRLGLEFGDNKALIDWLADYESRV